VWGEGHGQLSKVGVIFNKFGKVPSGVCTLQESKIFHLYYLINCNFYFCSNFYTRIQFIYLFF
jgi:hypothetical protein